MPTTPLSNDRIFYATQAVAIAPFEHSWDAYTTEHVAHGVQSIGITTNFNLEQVFELGQLEIYENVEGIPDVEVTMEKVVDGYPLLFHMASTGTPELGFIGAEEKAAFLNRSKQRCDVRLGIYEEDQGDNAFAAGATAVTDVPASAQQTEVYFSGMYLSNISYTIPVDGPMTESISFVGNNKTWLHSSLAVPESGVGPFSGDAGMALASGNTNYATSELNGLDEPLALTAGLHDRNAYPSGGVQRREDVMLAASVLPNSIRGTDGTTDAGNAWDTAQREPRIHIQNFSVSTDLSREDILELGRKNPYARPANFPIEVTSDIEAITIEGDFIAALEEGDAKLFETKASGENTQNETIKIVMRGGTVLDLGTRNRLSSVTYGGGDATGGNASVTYSFTNFNSFEIRQYEQIYQVGTANFKTDL